MLRSIRETPATADLRVVICAHSPQRQGEAWITGADGYLVHPFEADELVAEVTAVVAAPTTSARRTASARSGCRSPTRPTRLSRAAPVWLSSSRSW